MEWRRLSFFWLVGGGGGWGGGGGGGGGPGGDFSFQVVFGVESGLSAVHKREYSCKALLENI
jgi:hypothetical protein